MAKRILNYFIIATFIVFKLISAKTTTIDPYPFENYNEYKDPVTLGLQSSDTNTLINCASNLKSDFCYLSSISQQNKQIYLGTCDSSKYCQDGICVDREVKNINKVTTGDPCYYDAECKTGYCFEGKCSTSNNCYNNRDSCTGHSYCYFNSYDQTFNCKPFSKLGEECNDNDMKCEYGLVCQLVDLDEDLYFKSTGVCIKEMTVKDDELVSDRKACINYAASSKKYIDFINMKKGYVCGKPQYDERSCRMDDSSNQLLPCVYYMNLSIPSQGRVVEYYKYSECAVLGNDSICPPVLGDNSKEWNTLVETYRERIVYGKSEDKINKYNITFYDDSEYQSKFIEWRYKHFLNSTNDEKVKKCIKEYLMGVTKDKIIKNYDASFYYNLNIMILLIIFSVLFY